MLAYFANWGTELHMADEFNRWVSSSSCIYVRFTNAYLIGRSYFTSPHVCRNYTPSHTFRS